MVWKEPGKDKDPWNSHERSQDLERLVKNLQQWFGLLLGGKRGGGRHHIQAAILWWLLPVIVLAWLLSGFYKVAPGERGANFVFGRYIGASLPGLHWHAPWPVGHADVIQGIEGQDYTRSYNRLLTSDGTIVTVDAVAHYHVVNFKDYLFNIASFSGDTAGAGAGTRALLGRLVDAAVSSTVIQNSLQNILGSKRDAVEAQAARQLNGVLKSYDSGISVTRLTFQHVSVPESVGNTKSDLGAARQDANQAEAQAQAYADDLLPKAQNAADNEIAKARIYRTTLVNQAQADIARFNEVLAAYRKAPELTRETLYTQTMEEILSHARKVIVDTRHGNVTVQLIQPRQPAAASKSGTSPARKSASGSTAAMQTTTSTAAPAGTTHRKRL